MALAVPIPRSRSSAAPQPASTTQRPFLGAEALVDKQHGALVTDMAASEILFPESLHQVIE